MAHFEEYLNKEITEKLKKAREKMQQDLEAKAKQLDKQAGISFNEFMLKKIQKKVEMQSKKRIEAFCEKYPTTIIKIKSKILKKKTLVISTKDLLEFLDQQIKKGKLK
ncbi:hypothetical protein [Cetobacterium sp.]|uniref:hypothetical protein n=1 Tax=Cetobacterium sp. TaxID=2071632 RepID=UPI003F2D095C